MTIASEVPMKFRLIGYCICATLATTGATAAEPVVDVTNIEDFSLEDLLSATTSIASSKSMQLRAAPGVVTIISRDEIRRLGARDLLEVLVTVPGFDIGTDVLGTFAASFRGNWGNEGKILFLVDGIEMNETGYMSVPLFNHFPLEDVERIEVLRGPGSARYGNAAELAVVQIITRTGAARHNASVEFTGAQQRLPFENGSVALTGGTTVEALQGLDLTWNLHAGTRNTSDGRYTDVYGTAVELGGQNRANALWLNAAAQLPWMKLRLLVDGHESWDRTGYDDASVYDRAVKTAFPTMMVDAQFPIEAAPALSVTPRLTLQRGLPWWSFAEDGVQLEPSRLVADRARANVTTEWVPFAALTLRGGIEGTADAFRYVDQESQMWALDLVDTRFLGSDTVNYINGAVFGEANVDTPIFTVTMGARGEVHSEAGPSFVPRVALTRVFDRGHLKAIISGAFKAPSRVNFEVAPGISPERTRVIEGEVGIQPLDELYATLNIFDIDMKNPIVYGSAGNISSYANFPRTGSRGLELEVSAKRRAPDRARPT